MECKQLSVYTIPLKGKVKDDEKWNTVSLYIFGLISLFTIIRLDQKEGIADISGLELLKPHFPDLTEHKII